MKYLFFIAAAILLFQFGGFALLTSSSNSTTTESNKQENLVFLSQTKRAVAEKLMKDSALVENIVFSSERRSVVGGQPQVRLTFNYTSDSSTKEGRGSIVLAKDENQKWFYSSLKLK